MARAVDWDSSDEAAKAAGERIGRYKAEAGRRDIIRILSSCYAYRMHWIADRARYGSCGIDDDGGGTCLICAETDESGAQKYPPQEKYGTLIMLIASKAGRGEWKPAQQVMFWGFGRDKFKSIFELGEDYGDVRKIDLIVSCTDTQMQRLNFAPTGKDSQLDAGALKAQIENAKKWFKLSISPSTVEQQRRSLGIEDGDEVDNAVGRSLAAPGPAKGSAIDAPEDDEPESAFGSVQDEVESLLDEIGDI